MSQSTYDGPILDLARFSKAFWARGDVHVYLSYKLDDLQPCLVLIAGNRMPIAGNIIPSVIPLSMAYLYEPATGDAAHVSQFCAQALNNMGFDAAPGAVARLALVINDHLGDLLACPPLNEAEMRRITEGSLTATDQTTGRTLEMEVSRYV